MEKKENSEFEIIEIVDGFEYKYGFEYNDKRIVSEWLYRKSLETNRNTIILERTEEEISLGSSVRKECDIYKEQIPHEALALSFFNRLKLKTDIFEIVYQSIMDIMVAPGDFYEDRNVLKRLLPGTIVWIRRSW